MKTLSLTTFGLAVMALSLGTLPTHAESVHDLVDSIHPICAGSLTQADAYAHDLYQKLTTAGVQSYLIYFSWGDRCSDENQGALVVFQDEKGRFWGKQSVGACKWLSGSEPSDWVQSYYNDKLVSIFAISRAIPTGLAEASR